MPMTHVKMTLWDIDANHLRSLQPQIIFKLNETGVKPGGNIYVTRETVYTPDVDGTLDALLASTTDFAHDAWYTMKIRWLNPGVGGAPGYSEYDFPAWKIRVPPEGGALADMVGPPSNARVVYVSLTPPKDLIQSMLWLEQDPDNPDNPRNTGKLYEVRNTVAGLETVYMANLRGPSGPQGQPIVQKSAAVQVTSGVDGYEEGALQQNVRYPFKLSTGTKRVRLHIANYNDANDKEYIVPDLHLNMNVFIGRHRVTADGGLTGQFAVGCQAITNIPPGGLPIPGSTEVVTDWMSIDIQAGLEYLLSLSYYNPSRAPIASGMGFTWRSAPTGDVNVVGPVPGQSSSIKSPFSVWLEVEIPNTTPVVAHIGDSLLVGRESAYTLHDSYANKHAQMTGCMPRIYGIPGGRMHTYTETPNTPKWNRWANLPTADACIIQMGSNDVFDLKAETGTALETLKASLATLVPMVRERISPNIYLATIMPRNMASSGASINAVRRDYNDYLMTLPHGALGCFDFSGAVEDKANPDRVASHLVSEDNVHLLTGGYARMATAIPGPLAGPRIS